MTLQELIAMADGAPLPKEDVNVRLPQSAGPLIRTLIRVKRVRKDGNPWLYWFWTPRSDDGRGRAKYRLDPDKEWRVESIEDVAVAVQRLLDPRKK